MSQTINHYIHVFRTGAKLDVIKVSDDDGTTYGLKVEGLNDGEKLDSMEVNRMLRYWQKLDLWDILHYLETVCGIHS